MAFSRLEFEDLELFTMLRKKETMEFQHRDVICTVMDGTGGAFIAISTLLTLAANGKIEFPHCIDYPRKTNLHG